LARSRSPMVSVSARLAYGCGSPCSRSPMVSVSARLACGCGSPCSRSPVVPYPLAPPAAAARPAVHRPGDAKWQRRSSPSPPPPSRRPRSSSMAVGSPAPRSRRASRPAHRRVSDPHRTRTEGTLRRSPRRALEEHVGFDRPPRGRRLPRRRGSATRPATMRTRNDSGSTGIRPLRKSRKKKRSRVARRRARSVAVTANRRSTSLFGPPWADASPAAPARAVRSNTTSTRCAERVRRRERNGNRGRSAGSPEPASAPADGRGSRLCEHEVTPDGRSPFTRPRRRIRSA